MVVGLIVERGVDGGVEFIDVGGDEVSELRVLGVAPHRLRGVELRAVSGQVREVDPLQPLSVIRRSADRCTLHRTQTTISGPRNFFRNREEQRLRRAPAGSLGTAGATSQIVKELRSSLPERLFIYIRHRRSERPLRA